MTKGNQRDSHDNDSQDANAGKTDKPTSRSDKANNGKDTRGIHGSDGNQKK
jgi:hypothetical protein